MPTQSQHRSGLTAADPGAALAMFQAMNCEACSLWSDCHNRTGRYGPCRIIELAREAVDSLGCIPADVFAFTHGDWPTRKLSTPNFLPVRCHWLQED